MAWSSSTATDHCPCAYARAQVGTAGALAVDVDAVDVDAVDVDATGAAAARASTARA
jgi:hypothetical protein